MMKTFIKKALLFASILLAYKVLLLGVAVSLLPHTGNYGYYGADSGNPRIFLVGSSNLDHNYNYQLLNRYFLDYDVVGVCLNEPSGFYSLFNKLQQLSPGQSDIVIFCIPHSLYESEKWLPVRSFRKMGFSPGMVARAFWASPFRSAQNLLNLSPIDVSDLIRNHSSKRLYPPEIVNYSQSTQAEKDSLYNVCWVNPNGEFDIHSTGFEKRYLQGLYAFIHKHLNSKVYFRFPAVREKQYHIDQERLNFLSMHFDYINSFTSSIYPDELWYNQWYHLNRCGRDKCTRKLIDELKRIIPDYNTEQG